MTKLELGIKILEDYNNVKLKDNIKGFDAFRSLMNITLPNKLNDDYYKLQDEIIQDEYKNKKLVYISNLNLINNNIYIYKGDITLLKVDAIVNACNSSLLGCFQPLHNCIDNAIHSFAGLQVRRDLMLIMNKQGHEEENGKAKITNGYNLPAKYIIHTVGPIIYNKVSLKEINDLKNCYLSSLLLADKYNLKSIAFPCISTGIFNFPNNLACEIAFETVNKYLKETKSKLVVIFVVFKEKDYLLYYQKGSKK